MGQIGFIFEIALDEARSKAREARLACGYDSDTPQSDADDKDEGGFDQLEDSAWCNYVYYHGKDGEGGRD